jgi:type II secretory pathway pseudopilin PulG
MYIIKHIHKFNMLSRLLVGRSSGFALIGLVITMIILAILGAAIVKMISTASMNEVSANLAHKAQYMAESGYRYVASQYRNINTGDDKDDILNDVYLPNSDVARIYSLTPDPLSFALNVSSYFYKYSGNPSYPSNPTSIVGNSFHTVPIGIASHTGTGKIGIFNLGYLTNVRTYSSYTKAATSITFIPSGTAWPSAGSRLFPVVSTASTQTVTLGNDILLGTVADNDLSLLPAKNGSFRIYKEDNFAKYNDLLQYKQLAGTTLTGISRINGTSAGMTIAPTDYIVLQRFINLDSTGKAGDDTSNIFATRKLSYQIPIEAFAYSPPPAGGGLDEGKEGIFPDDNNYPLLNDPKFAVLPGLKSYEAVIQATGTNTRDTYHGVTDNSAVSFKFPNDVYNVHVNINWWRFVDLNLGLNFDQAYHVRGDFLSYDTQIKVRTWKQMNDIMVGISFRMNNNNVGATGNNYYGVSFFRSNNDDTNYAPWLGSPDGTLGNPGDPGYKLANLPKNQVFVVLWKRVNDQITLLQANQVPDLTANPGHNSALLYSIDWASLVVRLEETEVSGTKTNNFKIIVYDNDTNLLQTIKWPTEAEWAAVSPVTNSSITTQGLSHIPVPTKDGSGNYLEACEICISCGGVCGWPEIGVHVFADSNPDQKLYVDDFAIKLLGGGGGAAGGDIGFQPPISTP